MLRSLWSIYYISTSRGRLSLLTHALAAKMLSYWGVCSMPTHSQALLLCVGMTNRVGESAASMWQCARAEG